MTTASSSLSAETVPESVSMLASQEDPCASNGNVTIASVYEFLSDAKFEVRHMAMQIIVGMSLEEHGGPVTAFLAADPATYVGPLVTKLSDRPEIAALSWDGLTNFAAGDKRIAKYLSDNHLDQFLAAIASKDLVFTEAATKLMSNLTKYQFESLNPEKLLPMFVALMRAGSRHNPHCSYDFLASAIADLTNTKEGCQFFLDGIETGTDRLSTILLPELQGSIGRGSSSGNYLRRGGAAAAIKNCLFDVDRHQAILTREEEVEADGTFFLIAALSARLLDVRSEISDKELDALPLELQVQERSSEGDIAIRAMVIESLIILGTTLRGRECMRKKDIYPILREWHKLETNEDMSELVVKLVDLLIRDEQ